MLHSFYFGRSICISCDLFNFSFIIPSVFLFSSLYSLKLYSHVCDHCSCQLMYMQNYSGLCTHCAEIIQWLLLQLPSSSDKKQLKRQCRRAIYFGRRAIYFGRRRETYQMNKDSPTRGRDLKTETVILLFLSSDCSP